MRKSNNERFRIGLLVSNPEDEFDSAVCQGAMIAAEHTDADLFIFPGRYIDGVYADKIRTEYEYQYNTLFELPIINRSFDLLIILVGTIGSHLDKERRKQFIDRFAGTPVLTVTAQVDGYPSMTVDNKTGLVDVIEHLIHKHRCTRIGFVSGPKTSDDANERLAVYRETLEKNGIAYDDNRVVYGNFSKYTVPQTHELLDRDPDLQAIVYANDQMASAGYQAMKERGLSPGRDIYVTGFDNDPIADELIPKLTTVKSDVEDLGYNAVIEGLNLITKGKMERCSIPSAMVRRNSCGCTESARFDQIDFSAGVSESSEEKRTEVIADKLADFLFGRYRRSEETTALKSEFKDIVFMIDGYMKENNFYDTTYKKRIGNALEKMLSKRFYEYVELDDLYSVMEYLHGRYTPGVTDEYDLSMINRLFVKIYKISAELNAAYSRSLLEDNYFMSWQTNSITRDMLVFEAYDDRAYQTVVDKLTRLHMRSSYLFSYEPEIVNRKNDTFEMPEYVMLKAWHNGDEAVLQPADAQKIRRDELFTFEYLPKDRRTTIVVSPLFSNEEHYGLLLCETDFEYFRYIQSVTGQLCASLKIITMMKREAKTRKALRQSLIEIKENNELLDHLSSIDELTGCLNRRGFFTKMRGRLKDDSAEGSHAVMIFADLDSLKTINDRFGHSEGDFAIRSAAVILQRSFEGTEHYLGRIGGDEFVLCVFPVTAVEDILDGDEVREHIDLVTAAYNANEAAEKPYLVHTSVGIYPFTCSPDVEISALLGLADSLLYDQKKKKKSILRDNK